MNNTPFIVACITPHGGETIPELSPSNLDLMALTHVSMEGASSSFKIHFPCAYDVSDDFSWGL